MAKSIKPNKRKNGKDIAKYFGILKGDKEYDGVIKDINRAWSGINKKYA